MNYWDRNAPLPQAPQQIIQWRDAKDTVLNAYKGFAPEMANIAARFFDEGWTMSLTLLAKRQVLLPTRQRHQRTLMCF